MGYGIATLSVPLAGMAWAAPPSDPASNAADPAQAPGRGGVPEKIADNLRDILGPDAVDGHAPPETGPTPPVVFGISDVAKLGGSVPDSVGPPGKAVQIFTPACVNGLGCP